MPVTTGSFRQTRPQTPDWASRLMARPSGAQRAEGERSGVSEATAASREAADGA